MWHKSLMAAKYTAPAPAGGYDLWAWGYNGTGELGNGSTVNLSVPAKVNSDKWTAIAGGSTTTYGIKSDGTLWAWGSNSDGQLGVNKIGNQALVRTITSYSWSQVATYADWAIGIQSDGSLWGLGTNANGQLGTGDTLTRDSPVKIGSSSWSKIAASQNTAFGLTSTGALFTWGSYSTAITGITQLIQPMIPKYSWSQIAAGQYGGVGIKSDGSLWSWSVGSTSGLADRAQALTPVQIGTSSSWSKVAYGASRAFAITTTGLLYGWGDNTWGAATGSFPDTAPVQQVTPLSWSQISTGRSYAMGITSDGGLYAWGFGQSGGLGDGTTVNKSSPVKIGNSSWSQISSGYSHAAAITVDGLMYAWGANNFGALGDGTTTNRSSPVIISSGTSWAQVAAGTSFTAAISSLGGLYTTGAGANGVQGNSATTTNRSSPTQVGTSSWSKIAAGTSYVMGITVNGTLYSWGLNSVGQLGLGDVTARSSPVAVGSSSWVSISAGVSTSYGKLLGGTIYGWGDNTSGQVGVGSQVTAAYSSPVQIGTSSWVQLGLGGVYANAGRAINSAGQAYSWGSNQQGMLDNGRVGIIWNTPTLNALSTTSWSTVAASPDGGSTGFTAAIDVNGGLYIWGINTNGVIGDSTTVNKSSPIKLGTSSWSAVACGEGHILAITSLGALFTWGLSTSGQLGNGSTSSTTSRSSPVAVGTSSWVQVAAGLSHSHAIRTGGSLFGWGLNSSGQVGDSTITTRSSPVAVGTSSWSKISASPSGTAGILSTGLLYQWGLSTFLTYPTGLASASSPIQIGVSAGVISWSQVAAGYSNVLGIDTTGGMWVWGGATYGFGSGFNLVTPTQINTSSWSQIAASQFSVAAITIDGGLWTWGVNTYGTLGDGTSVDKSSPIKIGTSSWTKVFAGPYAYNVFGTLTNNILYGWGYNANGSLGDNTTVSKSSPVQLAGAVATSSWSLVSSANEVTVGLINGALYAWGLNSTGRLGLTDVVPRSSPVRVGTSSWASVAAGASGTVGTISGQGGFGWGRINVPGATSNRSSPVYVNSLSYASMAQVLAAADGFFAVDSTLSNLFYWGFSTAVYTNQVTVSTSSPVQISSDTNWSGLAASRLAAYATKTTGALYAWGANEYGQLGLGDTFTRISPSQIGSSSWSAVVSHCDATHAVAISADGSSMYAWGLNSFGQLGNGSTSNRSSPTLVASSYTGTGFNDVAVGSNFTAFISNIDNSLWVWGSNTQGQHGDGGVTSKSSPVQVMVGKSWYAIAAGTTFMTGEGSDLRIWGWGTGTSGQLGNNAVTNRSSPVLAVSVPVNPLGIFVTSTAAGYIDYDVSVVEAWTYGSNNNGQLGQGDTVSRSSPTMIPTATLPITTSGVYGTATNTSGVHLLI